MAVRKSAWRDLTPIALKYFRPRGLSAIEVVGALKKCATKRELARVQAICDKWLIDYGDINNGLRNPEAQKIEALLCC